MLYLSCRGILFFNQCIAFFVACFCNVSVPCRGILFFNYAWFTRLSSSKSFRPLSGNLIFQWYDKYSYERKYQCFRPLSGNLIFQWNDKRGAETVSNWVSVPCRGILFFNRTALEERKDRSDFRPLSGNLIFQWQLAIEKFAAIQFPSPIGESYFSIRKVLVKNDN